MATRTKPWISLGGGVLCLLLGAASFVAVQICFVQNFWLHAMVFPVNPKTITQPTALTYLGVACEIAFPIFLLAGVTLLLLGAWCAITRARRRQVGHCRLP